MTTRDTDTPERPLTETRQSNTHVAVPDDLRLKIERRLPGTEFESVDEYAVFVLEAVLREIDERGDEPLAGASEGARSGDEAVQSGDEDVQSGDEAIQDRLESLGYL